MSIDSTVSNVINLPGNFHDRGDVSVYVLLQESGYFAVHEDVTEGAIHDALRRHPEVANDWMDFSEAKRASSGWFLRRGGAKGFQVGYYPDHELVDYSDELAACAAFIKREIEDIRTDGRRS
jgi:hypothetical protein